MKKILGIILSVMLIVTFMLPNQALAAVKDGTYNVEATGMYDGLKLSVTFSNGKIADVTVVEHQETPYISDYPLQNIPGEIVAANSINVDTVSGATLTSQGIIDGVKQAITLAGGNIADFMGVSATEQEKHLVQLETEVVVAGAGMAGLTAALSAADNGYDVVLLEKMPFTGGSLGVAGGYFISVDSPVYANMLPEAPKDSLQDALGLFSMLSQLGDYTSETYPNLDKVEAHFLEIGATHEWLADQGIVWTMAIPTTPGVSLGMVVARGGGAGAAQDLTNTIREHDRIDLVLSTPATELIVENGKVVGVMAESDTAVYQITAANVILATGGFGSNPEMIAEYVPQFSGTVNTVAVGATGDGMKMAMDIGAQIYDEHWMVTAYPSPTQEFLDINSQARSLQYNSGAIVNQAGKRIVNEATFFTLVTNAIANNPTKSFAIFDSKNPEFVAICETGLENGNVYKGATLAELAENAGIDYTALEQTINDYNGYAATGVDAEFNKPAANLVAYDVEGPYYAVEYNHAIWGSMSGVVTDEYYRVLDLNGDVIDGLYAIGEMSNKEFYNHNYHGGASLSFYATMGRLVGEYLDK